MTPGERVRAWRLANPIRYKNSQKARYESNKTRILAVNKRYRTKHRGRISIVKKSKYYLNREKYLAGHKRRNEALRNEMLAEYGAVCICCGELRNRFLILDHIGGGGRTHRKKFHGGANLYREIKREGWPKDKYRILCMNCNFAVRFGPCPHKVEQNVLTKVAA